MVILRGGRGGRSISALASIISVASNEAKYLMQQEISVSCSLSQKGYEEMTEGLMGFFDTLCIVLFAVVGIAFCGIKRAKDYQITSAKQRWQPAAAYSRVYSC